MNPIRKDFEIASFAVATYDYIGWPTVAWDYFETETTESPVCFGLKYVGEDTVLALRGSVTAEDWVRNLDAWPVEDAELGMVHPGFLAGLRAVWSRAKPRIKGRLYIGAHSRAAGQGAQLAAIAILDKITPARVVLLGCPRPGGEKLAKILDGHSIGSYRAICDEEKDPVCDVPFDLPPAFAYVAAAPLADLPVVITKAATADLGPFAIHFSPGYVAALQAKGL